MAGFPSVSRVACVRFGVMVGESRYDSKSGCGRCGVAEVAGLEVAGCRGPVPEVRGMALPAPGRKAVTALGHADLPNRGQSQPFSISQTAEHPSPSFMLPSSQVSLPPIT